MRDIVCEKTSPVTRWPGKHARLGGLTSDVRGIDMKSIVFSGLWRLWRLMSYADALLAVGFVPNSIE